LQRDRRALLRGLFEEITEEFESPRLGSELRLRTLLIEILVQLVRWEKAQNAGAEVGLQSGNWMQIQKALSYVHERYAEPIYIREIAAVAGINIARLQQLFHSTVGISCVQYIQWCRLYRAMALLSGPEARITDIAYEVGFETLSHFNASFRRFLNMSPSEYVRRQNGKLPAIAAKTGGGDSSNWGMLYPDAFLDPRKTAEFA